MVFNHLYNPADGGWFYYGYCIDLIHRINDSLQFDMEILEPSDELYGSMQENGSWTGMVNDLIHDVRKHGQ